MDYKFIFPRGVESDPLNTLNIGVDVGIAGQIYVMPRLYIDINVDFVTAFSKDMILGIILPGVGVGWQF